MKRDIERNFNHGDAAYAYASGGKDPDKVKEFTAQTIRFYALAKDNLRRCLRTYFVGSPSHFKDLLYKLDGVDQDQDLIPKQEAILRIIREMEAMIARDPEHIALARAGELYAQCVEIIDLFTERTNGKPMA